MAGRDVQLNIKVNDSDVKKAEASLNRLNKAAHGEKSMVGGQKATETAQQQSRLAAFMGSELPKASNAAQTAISAVEDAMANILEVEV